MNDTVVWQELTLAHLAAEATAQAVVEGDAALPGSMRDAVNVLAVHAQAAAERVQAQSDQIGVNGRVNFHVLYTQGDLTRIQVLETGCDFSDVIAAPGVSADMRVCAQAQVVEASASASGGRLHLRAAVNLQAQATQEKQLRAAAGLAMDAQQVRTRMAEVGWACMREIGRERTLLREEFELPGALGVSETLFAAAQVNAGEITGGEGRAQLTGVIDLCVYHAGTEKPLVVTRHAMPFEIGVNLSERIPADAQLFTHVTLRDVLADSMNAGEGERVLRVEVEVDAAVQARETHRAALLQDAYTLSGDALELTREEISLGGQGACACARDSGRMLLTLGEGQEPVATVLGAFATPLIGTMEPEGTQLRVDGVLDVTVIYLPADSGIPVSAAFSQAFTARFDGVGVGTAQLSCTEITASGVSSDRIEARYALKLCACTGAAETVRVVTQVKALPAPEQSGGICVYFPGEGETLWDIARRYRVDEAALARANPGREATQPVIVLRRREM